MGNLRHVTFYVGYIFCVLCTVNMNQFQYAGIIKSNLMGIFLKANMQLGERLHNTVWYGHATDGSALIGLNYFVQ